MKMRFRQSHGTYRVQRKKALWLSTIKFEIHVHSIKILRFSWNSKATEILNVIFQHIAVVISLYQCLYIVQNVKYLGYHKGSWYIQFGMIHKSGPTVLVFVATSVTVLGILGKFKMNNPLNTNNLQFCISLQYKIWLKPSAEQQFLYGHHVMKSGLGRITENTAQYQGVVVYSMSDMPLVSLTHSLNPGFICHLLRGSQILG